MQALFDVVITSYRRPELTKAAILSCASQKLIAKIIVVDDASKDDSVSTIKGIRDPRIALIERATNGGIAAARHDGFVNSTAPWTISLDSDHELLPCATEVLTNTIQKWGNSVDIIGARYKWDTGLVSPVRVPEGSFGYRERIAASGSPDGIGVDYLCTVSQRLRAAVSWERLRSNLPDSLFQLDAAKFGKAVFSQDVLAIQKSCRSNSWTRGTAENRWARRQSDAADGVAAFDLILSRHGEALKSWGRPALQKMYMNGVFFAILNGKRGLARKWLRTWKQDCGDSRRRIELLVLARLPLPIIRMMYIARG